MSAQPTSVTTSLLACLVLSGCVEREAANQAGGSALAEPLVVLTMSEGPDGHQDPIQGAVRCDSDADPLCVQDVFRVAEAVLNCGPIKVTIDRSLSHVEHVFFASGLHERFPAAIPSDIDIVRCVQARVGFRFAAGIAPNPEALLDMDQRPFSSLHSRGR